MKVTGESAEGRTEGVSMRIAKASAIISGKWTVAGQGSGKQICTDGATRSTEETLRFITEQGA